MKSLLKKQMNKLKKNNIVNFPNNLIEGEREVEAILFAAAEPLDTVSYTHLTLPTTPYV